MNKDEILALAGSWAAKKMTPRILATGIDLGPLKKEFPECQIQTNGEELYDLAVADLDHSPWSLSALVHKLNIDGILVFGSHRPHPSTCSLPWTLANGKRYFVHFRLRDNEQENHHFLQAACYDFYAYDYTEDVEFLKAWLKGASSVLEIGVGTGRLARVLKTLATDYAGIDTSAAMLRTLRRSGLAIPTTQASMLDFHFERPFDRIFYPFRVFHYLKDDREMEDALKRAVHHLTPDGSILINMIDFDSSYIERWNGRSSDDHFKGPDGSAWTKTDHMEFKDRTMYRRIEFKREGALLSQTRDNLTWRSALELGNLCARCGLEVSNLWPAFEFRPYSGEFEYVLEARRR